MNRNAKYSYFKMTDTQKTSFAQSLQNDYLALLRIYGDCAGAAQPELYGQESNFHSVDEDRLEQLADIYAEIKDTHSFLAEKVKTLACLMVISSGTYFVMQKNVRDMYQKYPDACGLDKMYDVFVWCFDNFDANDHSVENCLDISVTDADDLHPANPSNVFMTYFQTALRLKFTAIFNRKESKAVYQNTYSTSFYFKQQEKKDGDFEVPRICSQQNYFSIWDEADARAYYFSNLIAQIFQHMLPDGERRSSAVKKMFSAFFTGDTVALAKCDMSGYWYQAMEKSENRILDSCLDDFFAFVLSAVPQTIRQVQTNRIKTYGEMGSDLLKDRDPAATPVLYIPKGVAGRYSGKRYGFEDLIYAAFLGKDADLVSDKIKLYIAFREKYLSQHK